MCVKVTKATAGVRQRKMIPLGESLSMSAARDMATGSNRVVPGPMHRGAEDGAGDKEEMADAAIQERATGVAREVMMAGTDGVTRTMTDTGTETETEGLVPMISVIQSHCARS